MDEVLDGVYRIDIPRSEQVGWLPETDEPVGCHVFTGDRVVLFGTGYGWFADLLIDHLEAVGGVDDIVVEHGDADHYGGLAALRREYPDVRIAMPRADAPTLKKVYSDLTADIELNDGDEIAGFRSIAIPGHTAGNMSFLDAERRILVVGDTFVHSDSEIAADGDWSGAFAPIEPVYNMRDGPARENLTILRDYEFDHALITHGPDVIGGARGELDRLLDDLEL